MPVIFNHICLKERLLPPKYTDIFVCVRMCVYVFMYVFVIKKYRNTVSIRLIDYYSIMRIRFRKCDYAWCNKLTISMRFQPECVIARSVKKRKSNRYSTAHCFKMALLLKYTDYSNIMNTHTYTHANRRTRTHTQKHVCMYIVKIFCNYKRSSLTNICVDIVIGINFLLLQDLNNHGSIHTVSHSLLITRTSWKS